MSGLFTIIPLASAVCNLFLLLTMLSARKSKAIRSFILLTLSFTVWTLASLFMRLSFSGRAEIWFHVSMSAILFVPALIYYFLISYVGEKNTVILPLFLGGTVLLVFLDSLGVFIGDPRVALDAEGLPEFTYSVHVWAVLPLLFAAAELLAAVQVVLRSVKNGTTRSGAFTPLFTGVGIMFLAMLLDLIPGLSSGIPLDPLACMVNAILLYVMLYQKRLFTLVQLASSASAYLFSAVMTGTTMLAIYPIFDSWYTGAGLPADREPLAAAALAIVLEVLALALVRLLFSLLFVNRYTEREAKLRGFGMAVGQTLDRDKILHEFLQFLTVSTASPRAFIFTKEGVCFVPAACSDSLKKSSLILKADSPVMDFLRRQGQSVTADTLLRAPEWRAAWESEKNALKEMDIELILPVMAEGQMNSIALLAAREGHGSYSFEELNFLDSAASIAGMAMKNVLLYEQIQTEARKDHMTELWNRSYFTELLDEELEKKVPLTLALLKMDDFRLYNELYGSDEGDKALRYFSEVLREVIGSAGILCCSGVDFYLAFPALSPAAVKGILTACREKLQSYKTERRRLSFSGGLCAFPETAKSRKELLTFAGLGVEQAKRSGKDRIVIYGEDKDEDARNRVEQLGREYAPTIYALTAAIDAKDHYTFTHCENVTNLSTQLARAAGFEEEYVEMIRQAGLLHDVGKISIPEGVLTKPGRLTDEEYDIMKSHVNRSIEIIRHLPSLNYVVPIVVGHHERWDGRGYPRGLAGADIPPGARCVALADSFDAIASRRVYKAAVPVDKAIDEIERCLGTQFDPELGALFVKLLRSGEIDTAMYRKKTQETEPATAAEAVKAGPAAGENHANG